MKSDASYFMRRATEERLAARRAKHAIARDVHLEMAERYADLALAIQAHDTPTVGSDVRLRVIR